MRPKMYLQRICVFALCAVALLSVTGWAKSVVVTTSMLESAVRDSLGAQAGIEIERIIPPGNCPGHFDLKPRMLASIRKSDLFIYHDFQKGVKSRIAGLGAGLATLDVKQPGSWLVPSNYWQVVDYFRQVLPKKLGLSDSEMASGSDDLDRLEAFWRDAVKRNGWKGVPVVASAMQSDFCSWLGFKVVAKLPRSEELTPEILADLVDSGAAIVVGNNQSDGQSARMLGKRIRIPTAVLDNFPSSRSSEKAAYRILAEHNLKALERAWRKR